MRHPGRKDNERTGVAVVQFTLYLDAHSTAQDVENLIDGVNVHPGWGSAAWGCLDAIDCAVLGAGCVIEQFLGQALVSAALVDGFEINRANVFHWGLLAISFWDSWGICTRRLCVKKKPKLHQSHPRLFCKFVDNQERLAYPRLTQKQVPMGSVLGHRVNTDRRNTNMPLVIIEADEGRTVEQKRGLVKDITEAVCKNFNVPPEAVSIRIHKGKKENRAKAGKLAID